MTPPKDPRPVVIREITRPSTELIAAYKELPVANIADAMGKPSSWTMDPAIRPAFDDIKVTGPAVTVKEHPTCNLMTHVAIGLAEAGDVIVVDTGGFTDVAVGGFLMARMMMSKGLSGVVVDGAWRDRSEIRVARFPVFARAWQPTGPHKDWPGSVNVPITCGGIVVNPGDILVGDDDGVIVVPRESAVEVLERAQEIHEREAGVIQETQREVIERPIPQASEERLRKLGVEFR